MRGRRSGGVRGRSGGGALEDWKRRRRRRRCKMLTPAIAVWLLAAVAVVGTQFITLNPNPNYQTLNPNPNPSLCACCCDGVEGSTSSKPGATIDCPGAMAPCLLNGIFLACVAAFAGTMVAAAPEARALSSNGKRLQKKAEKVREVLGRRMPPHTSSAPAAPTLAIRQYARAETLYCRVKAKSEAWLVRAPAG